MTRSSGPLPLIHVVHRQDAVFQKFIFHQLTMAFFFWTKLLPVASSKLVFNGDATEWPDDLYSLSVSSITQKRASPFFQNSFSKYNNFGPVPHQGGSGLTLPGMKAGSRTVLISRERRSSTRPIARLCPTSLYGPGLSQTPERT